MPFSDLYRYATPTDKLSLVVGVLCACVNGSLFPCMALVFGDAISSFTADGGVDSDAINSAALDIAIGLFFTDYVAYVLVTNTAEREMKALRNEALSLLVFLSLDDPSVILSVTDASSCVLGLS